MTDGRIRVSRREKNEAINTDIRFRTVLIDTETLSGTGEGDSSRCGLLTF